MPLYEYECRKCQHNFELIHSHTDEDNKPCEACGCLDTFKVIHSPGVVFKGSGFYLNDSREAAKEAVKKKYEGDRYLNPEQRGDTARLRHTESVIGPSKNTSDKKS